eukprot:CAMPEP_0175281156 /NCGR_PEP_ID=MMETSP0093-20121207/50950_1 /TAXON_ID=311494 /ORGANISM="Alexandrium monilatum, Strain CCMP3105" /LENGTH=105 /DNA_ID=CAMNT_0016576277 /DNA_START=47 /DNA_END=364 /DNA_ORIENTATION=-
MANRATSALSPPIPVCGQAQAAAFAPSSSLADQAAPQQKVLEEQHPLQQPSRKARGQPRLGPRCRWHPSDPRQFLDHCEASLKSPWRPSNLKTLGVYSSGTELGP